MGKYFGTDGFRGEANVTLTSGHAYRIGRFLGWYYGRDGKKARIVIGRDTRLSGEMLEYAAVAGITASGGDAFVMGVTTTPNVSYITYTDSFSCGVMISASHNPYTDNGIKLMGRNGEKMDDETVMLLEKYLDGTLEMDGTVNGELPYATLSSIGTVTPYSEGREKYKAFLVSEAGCSLHGYTVALDTANGSAYKTAREVFEALGARTLVINAEPDGLNINRDAGSTHIEGLRKFVLEKGCDSGFAFDGDADRCLCVDGNGSVVTGDHILYIAGRDFRERGMLPGNTVVTTVMSNYGLYRAFDASGIGYVKTNVGDRYVYEEMVRHGYALGGEQSGHIIFSAAEHTGDGILTALRMMETVVRTGKTLSELSEGLVIYPQILRNVRVDDRAGAMADPSVLSVIREEEERLGERGRILVRPSGTEPLLRVMAEAETEEMCSFAVERIIDILGRRGWLV